MKLHVCTISVEGFDHDFDVVLVADSAPELERIVKEHYDHCCREGGDNSKLRSNWTTAILNDASVIF